MEFTMMIGCAGPSLESIIAEAGADCPPGVNLPFVCLEGPEVDSGLPFFAESVGGDGNGCRGVLGLI